LWETPVITPALKAIISERFPDTHFLQKDDGNSIFVMHEVPQTDERYAHFSEGERYDCPMLGETGCKLGDEKPFECAVWPFRIMSQNNKLLISVSTLCKPICKNSLQNMLDVLESGAKQKLADYAYENPGIVKPYNDGYPILMYL
jgi:hypothetical protein